MFTHLLLRSFSEESDMGMIVKSYVSTSVLKSYNHEGIHIPAVSRDLLDSEVDVGAKYCCGIQNILYFPLLKI